MPRSTKTPSYRLHRASGQAIVTLGGRDVYLGKHDSPESRAEYDRIIAEWLANGRRLASSPESSTVSELILPYVEFASGYYRKNGVETTEVRLIKSSLKTLRKLYGHTPAAKFGPLALKAVRQAYIEEGLCRSEVNRRTRHVKRFLRWASENELVPPATYHGLLAVRGLAKGRCEVRESEPVGPVPDEHVDALRPFVVRQVWTMIELQRLSGMRPGEVCQMKTRNIDTAGPVWVYVPDSRKTEHRGKDRKIYLGPKSQEILRGWLRPDPDGFLFNPIESRPAPKRPKKKKKGATPGRRRDHYTVCSYEKAIVRACKRAGVPQWAPNRLRHNAATRLRREFGLDTARVILGHSSPTTTEVYAEVDRDKAVDVMGRIG